jgi:hypothetical protein
MRRRILVGARASDQVLSSYRAPARAVTQSLLDAFVNRRMAVIRYQDQHGNLTVREIEFITSTTTSPSGTRSSGIDYVTTCASSGSTGSRASSSSGNNSGSGATTSSSPQGEQDARRCDNGPPRLRRQPWSYEGRPPRGDRDRASHDRSRAADSNNASKW